MSLRRYLSFKWRYLLLLTIAVFFTALSLFFFVRYLIKPNTGLVVNYPEVIVEDGKVIFSPKTPFSPAVSSGLKPKIDQILSINGEPVRGSRDVVEADGRIWSFNPFPVTILRGGMEQTVYVTPAVTPARLDWVFALVFSIALGFTVFYLIIRIPEDTASNFIALAALFYLVFTTLKPFYYESFLSNLLIHLGKLTSWFMVFFGLYFPRSRGKRVLRWGVILTILGLYAAFIISRMYLYTRWAETGAEQWLVLYRQLGKFNNISDGIAFAIYAVLLISAYVRSAHLQEKRQIEWILAGFLIGIPPYFFLDQLPLILGQAHGLRISMGSFANLFLAFVPLFFIVGLLKHGVFNIKYFVHRYIAYFLLVVVIFSFFTVLYEPVQKLFMASYGLPARIAGFIVVSLLFVLLVPIRSMFITILERLFYRSHYTTSLQYSASLERRNMELRLIIDELNRQNIRSFQTDKMRELRGIITGIAHRVNNPVNYISSSLSSLEKKISLLLSEVQEPRVEELNRLSAEIRHLMQIAQDGDFQIKDFVRKLVSLVGTRSSVPVSVSVSQLLKNAEMELREKYPPAALNIRIDSVSRLTCHPGELIQALHYICENAVEAVEDEEIEITALENKGYISIEVRDRGSGIDELNLKKVFDPFFTTKSGHEGLGLYFCRTIVERNSGSIEIESKLGSGTRVKLLLVRDKAILPQVPTQV